MTTNATTQVKADASTDDYPLADYAISETTVKRARWENLQIAPCPGANRLNVCNYSHGVAAKADHTHTVTVDNGMPVTCTCAAFTYNDGLCKHCLACANDHEAMDTAEAKQPDDTDTTTEKAVTDGGTTVDPLGDIERTGGCDHCNDTGTTENGQPCFICPKYGEDTDDNETETETTTAIVTDGGQDNSFDPTAETVTDAWEGAFIHTNWGYGQTNIEFAQIIDVSESGKTVLARRVTAEQVGHGKTTDELRPTPEQFGDEFRLHVRNTRGNPAFRGSYPYINGDMDEGTRLDTFLPFGNPTEDTVRQTAPNHGH
jgi:uncharacterized Zn ribbon protein